MCSANVAAIFCALSDEIMTAALESHPDVGRINLDAQQVEAFGANGYVVLPRCFSEAAVARMRRWCEEAIAAAETPSGFHVYREPSRLNGQPIVKRIENLSINHAGFASLAELVRRAIERLVGERMVLYKEKVNYKLPGGGGYKAHQDSQGNWENHARFFVTAMVSIDASTRDNGCVWFAPRPQRSPSYKDWFLIPDEALEGLSYREIPTGPGDVIFLDSYTPHRSEPNLTRQSRRIYFATYNRLSDGDQRAAYYERKLRKYFPGRLESIKGGLKV